MVFKTRHEYLKFYLVYMNSSTRFFDLVFLSSSLFLSIFFSLSSMVFALSVTSWILEPIILKFLSMGNHWSHWSHLSGFLLPYTPPGFPQHIISHLFCLCHSFGSQFLFLFPFLLYDFLKSAWGFFVFFVNLILPVTYLKLSASLSSPYSHLPCCCLNK